MNEKFFSLLKRLKNTSGELDFFEELKNFFEAEYERLKIETIKMLPVPPYFFPLSEFHDVESIVKNLYSSTTIKKSNGFFVAEGYYFYPLTKNKIKLNYLLVFNRDLENYINEIKLLCDLLQDVFLLANKNFNAGFEENDLQSGNLISQMSHDVNSLISLIKNDQPQIKDSVVLKMNYAVNMTKDILQYVREIQILDSEVEITELLESIIQNTPIPQNIEIDKIFKTESETIELDVELINRAVSEILKNSITSIGENAGKIKVNASINVYENLLNKNKFLKISVEDSGKSINPDFIGFVKNPFFTTLKSEYHSGLGLSIAEKIIKAHEGFLNIENKQDKNTTLVTIYLPMQRKSDE